MVRDNNGSEYIKNKYQNLSISNMPNQRRSHSDKEAGETIKGAANFNFEPKIEEEKQNDKEEVGCQEEPILEREPSIHEDNVQYESEESEDEEE